MRRDRDEPSPYQLAALTDCLPRPLGYQHKLIEHMETEAFPANDKLIRTACEVEICCSTS
jgi:hypothetical protein